MNNSRKNSLSNFQKKWGDIKKLKNMTLEQYTNANTPADTFTYWIEWGTRSLGSITGAYSIKAGIYAKVSKSKNDIGIQYMQDDDYLWYKSLGDNPNVAFKKVLTYIMDIINAVNDGDLSRIDKVPTLWRGYKYKIAFLYQLILNKPIKILPVFNWDDLSKFLGNTDINASMLDLYQKAIKKYNINSVDDAFAVADKIYDNNYTDAQTEYKSSTYNNPIEELDEKLRERLIKDLSQDERIAIFSSLTKEQQIQVFNNLDKSTINDILNMFDEDTVKPLKTPCLCFSIIMLMFGCYVLCISDINNIISMSWFWILWLPITAIIWILPSILKLTCSQLKQIFSNHKKDKH